MNWIDAVNYVNSHEMSLAWAAAIPLAISGISALSGLFSNRAKQAQQTQTSTTTQTDTPQYDDKTLYMRNMLMDKFMDRTRFNEDFFGGYSNEGLKNINNSSDIAKRSIENVLAARGLSGSSAGASSEVSRQLNRLNQQSSFLNTIPLLKDQREQQNLTGASNFFQSIPTGTTRTATTTGTGTATQPGNMLGGLFGGLGSALGGLYGAGAFGKYGPTKTPGTTINIGSGGIGTPTPTAPTLPQPDYSIPDWLPGQTPGGTRI